MFFSSLLVLAAAAFCYFGGVYFKYNMLNSKYKYFFESLGICLKVHTHFINFRFFLLIAPGIQKNVCVCVWANKF